MNIYVYMNVYMYIKNYNIRKVLLQIYIKIILEYIYI